MTGSVAGLGLLGLAAAAKAVLKPPTGVAAGIPAAATTTITRETLVDVTTVPGKLAYGPEVVAESRLAGTVTGLPAVGATVDRGEALFRIDDKPVVLLFGSLPTYRELNAGGATRGADVKQFKENLRALGYRGFVADEQFSESAAVAVRRWQKDLGLEQTGVVELGRVFYTPGPIRVAAHKLALGKVATGPVLAYTGTARLVTATIKAHDQELAKATTKVTIELSSGKQVKGTVQSVRTPEEPEGGPEPTLEAVVALDDPASVNGLDDGPVRVRLVAAERKDVLVVSVGALLALAEGGYGLEIIEPGSTRVVAVTTGLFANGRVEVSGPDIRAGMTVGMAR